MKTDTWKNTDRHIDIPTQNRTNRDNYTETYRYTDTNQTNKETYRYTDQTNKETNKQRDIQIHRHRPDKQRDIQTYRDRHVDIPRPLGSSFYRYIKGD